MFIPIKNQRMGLGWLHYLGAVGLLPLQLILLLGPNLAPDWINKGYLSWFFGGCQLNLFPLGWCEFSTALMGESSQPFLISLRRLR